ncbi:TKL protein kinase [Salpingoeca rosetta]|uniref:TKL protein kinase n=1 Tax=Salpingoeca rosetta (strain ATCC 50818 / BSB-021) TaxID=946362 RepID=F2UQS6_SALR5|nr:TKL protein kinase [Salpingoeca rosetta]EGD79981.1 TKL protein kinase [Salpingoeca rosetta]|eukprot:XP_004988602.1 TKL protein kinase [Salpingoeca rosetta]
MTVFSLALIVLVASASGILDSTLALDVGEEAAVLCDEVETTLKRVKTTLVKHSVPFSTTAGIHKQSHDDVHLHTENGAAVNHTHVGPRLTVDLSSIQRMMRAFGCPKKAARKLQRPTNFPGTRRHNPQPNILSDNNTAPSSLPRRFSRMRRNSDPNVQQGQCTLASLIDGSCPGTRRGGLTITLFKDDLVNGSADTSTLRTLSPAVFRLTLNGHVQQPLLQWLLQNGVWTTCRFLTVEGAQFPTFPLSDLNPLSDIRSIRIRHSDVLRGVDSSGFNHAKTLTALRIINCSLSFVPDVAGMTSLRTLSLRDNRIRQVTAEHLNGLSSLRELSLDTNLIARVQAVSFGDLTALRRLTIFSNDISAIPPGLFHPLTALTRLELQRNPIRQLDADVFAALSTLDNLILESTLLTSLPPTVFRNTTRLTVLGLANNFLTSLPETVFAGLSSLEHLQVFNNRLTSLASDVFQDLTVLTALFIDKNELRSLPRGLLQSNTRLRTFFCNDNRLTALPSSLFANTSALNQASLATNALRSIDAVIEAASFSSLSFLDVHDNQLTRVHLPRALPALRELAFNDNPVRELPNLDMLPELRVFRLQHHLVRRIDLAAFLALPHLEVLELDAAPEAESKAVLSDSSADRIAPLAKLSVENVDISAIVSSLGQLASLNLSALHAGWPGATSDTLPISALCSMLASTVQELRIANTHHSGIDLCPDKAFDVLLLTDNRRLESITVHDPLRELNVSGCTQLTSIDAPPIDILDISSTNLPLTGALCTRWGRRVLFARNLGGVVDIRRAAAIAHKCLEQVDVLDLSGNSWLRHQAEINRVVETKIVLSHDMFLSADFGEIANRPIPPIFQLTDAPIECELELSNQNLRLHTDRSVLTPQIVYAFHCTCARGFKLTSNGRCVERSDDIAGVAAGSVIGGLFFGLFVAWLSRRYRGLTKRIGLQEQLLVEMDEEVTALKKAWEIGFGELRLVERVAAGAFGVVFKAEWDTVMVAVKVLQQSVMMFDESTVLEFEKEVEFLQRTRHPNVVRFFGAGTDPSGSPFLVLEFVAMGSLKDLLGKDMEQVLMEVKRDVVGCTDAGVVAEDVDEELTLISTESDRRAETMTIWELKLRLLRDIASGMAFIHSLDQMHRDLKSGNVLVSSSLRAKITDFGSIRQCFTRGGGGGRAHGSGHTRLSSSSHDVDDPQYSQQAGLQTMTSMTLTAGVGTPLYMAPEALTGDKYSFEADIFSFGVLMWEVATQRPPDLIEQEKGSDFRGSLLPAITELLMEGKRLKFEDSEQEAIPEWFQSLTYKCMAQNPRERPSFGELKDHHFA